MKTAVPSDPPSTGACAGVENAKPANGFTSRLGALLGLSLGCSGVLAGSAVFDFNQPLPSNLILAGHAAWRSGPGRDPAGTDHSGGIDQSGYMALVDATPNQISAVLLPDFDNGLAVGAITLDVELRVGNPLGNEGSPAEGFSINFVRDLDPVVLDLCHFPPIVNWDNYASPGAPESGTWSGLSICFDSRSGHAWPNGDTDMEGIVVRVDNVTKAKVTLPTRNGPCDDAGSLQTGPYDSAHPGSPDGLCWAHLRVLLEEDGTLALEWKGRKLIDALPVGFTPGAVRFLIAGRTGVANQSVHLDDVRITTIPRSKANLPSTAKATARVAGGGVAGIDLLDSGYEYYVPPAVELTGGEGTGATAVATVEGGLITAIKVTSAGNGYTSAPRVILPPPPSVSRISLTRGSPATNRVRATLNVVPGRSYQMQSSLNLITWELDGASFVAASPEVVREYDADAAKRFYRLQWLPGPIWDGW